MSDYEPIWTERIEVLERRLRAEEAKNKALVDAIASAKAFEPPPPIVIEGDGGVDATWNAALEAAALKADEEANGWEAGFHRWRDTDIDAADRCSGRETVARNVAGAIRALKRGQSSTSAKPPCDSCHERPRGAGLSVCESCAKAIYGRRVSP